MSEVSGVCGSPRVHRQSSSTSLALCCFVGVEELGVHTEVYQYLAGFKNYS